MSISPINLPLPGGPIPPVPPVTPPPEVTNNVVRQIAAHAPGSVPGAANAPSHPNFIAPHIYNQKANVIGGPTAQRMLMQDRRARSQKPTGNERNDILAKETVAPDQDPIALVLDVLQRHRGRHSDKDLDQELQSRGWDVLQRHRIYRDARKRLRATGNSPEALALHRELGRVLDRLTVQGIKELDVYRFMRLTHDAELLQQKIDGIVGAQDPAIAARLVPALARFGGPRPHLGERDRVVVPPDALGLINVARTFGGDDGCLEFLRSSRAPMLRDLRQPPRTALNRHSPGIGSFPSYWLSMQTVRAYTLAQSAIAFAQDLARGIAEQIKRAPALKEVEIAQLLLGAANNGWGKSKAGDLVNGIIAPDGLDLGQRALACRKVRAALARLPLTAWSNESLGARAELLDELQNRAAMYDSAIPGHNNNRESRIWQARLEQAMRARRPAQAG